MKNYEDKNKRTNPIVNADGNEDSFAWISNTGNSLASILDVILNGNSPAKQGNYNMNLAQEKNTSYVWWIVGGGLILGTILLFSVYLKKK